LRRREFLAALSSTALAADKPFDPDFGTAIEAAAAIQSRKISPAELAAHTMARIARLDPKLNSICWKFDAPKSPPLRGLLSGVPITVKESFAVAGSPATYGLVEHKDYRSKTTATAVSRLQQAGAWVAGKTNVPPRLADWQSDNPIYGRTNNPWDLARTCGGSSGGSAAALAAGFGFLSLGSDIGGSIRVPAHFCGVYGHKPTLDLVPRSGHAAGPNSDRHVLSTGLSVCGPMARGARDLALAMPLLAGPDGEDAVAYKAILPPPRQTKLTDFRVGYYVDDKACPLLPEVAAAVDSALGRLAKAGVRMKKGLPDGLDAPFSLTTYRALLFAAMGLEGGEKIPFDRWRNHTSGRMQVRSFWQEAFREIDAFLMPVAFCPAFSHDSTPSIEDRRIDGRRYDDLLFWQHFPLLSGHPATAVPIGRTKSGLPVGLQAIGPFLEDLTPIEFAALMEPVCGGFEKPPLFA
jgi:amidase